ncbi:MAG: DNA-directed RNA polymerase subunit beta [Ardenticatenales bacterium]|nr:DNA-directed RNA polymerase subunit beta [Ardenticatenales bacterium]
MPKLASRYGVRDLPIKDYASIPPVLDLPDLIDVQIESYRWFLEEGLRELFDEISPIESFNGNLQLDFLDYWFEEPKYTENETLDMDLTYGAPMWVKARLINKETGEMQEQDVFMGEFPLMTPKGTFINNGSERVVVSQLIRSPNAYFSLDEDRTTGRRLSSAKLIPNRGAWMEFETSRRDVITVKVDRKRKIPFTIFMRALGAVPDGFGSTLIQEGSDEELYALFGAFDEDPEHKYLEATIERDPTKNAEEALLDMYRKLRPGDPATVDNAKSYLESLLFNPRRYDLGKVGRYKLNKQLKVDVSLDDRTLRQDDIVRIVQRVFDINNDKADPDDIDHLGNRRVKRVGELVQNQLRVGLLRMERVVRERMSIRDPEQLTPISLINIRPVVAAVREFFGGSQLSQFMEQTNPLAELRSKRTLSALGPGGLKRERAGFDVRDVHYSHYGRICPIETPEGPNIGLIGRLATFGRVNDFGFIETPYRKVLQQVANDGKAAVGERIRDEVVDPESGATWLAAGDEIDDAMAAKLATLDRPMIKIVPRVSDEIVYLTADEEEQYTIAQANAKVDEQGYFVNDRASVRISQHDYRRELVTRVDFQDVSPKQIVGVSAALIPFLEHDDANRALMGSNMQSQAVPLVRPEAPIVSTGMEYRAARDSGQVVQAQHDGQVVSVTSQRVIVRDGEGEEHVYPLRRYTRSNQSTTIDQHPVVLKGQWVQKGDVLADSSSTEAGELALGQNVLVAFLSWEGANFEDAIIISEEMVRHDRFTSIHIEKYEVEARDTKLGPEEITRDIPNVGEDALKDLDERGIIRIGAEVGPNDILVGKITPKGETELTPEEKLLRAIFGEKAREVRDSSLRLPHGSRGKVVDIREFTRENHQDLSAGVEQLVRVSVAQTRKLQSGDKMAGRHGNKGVISQVVPIEDLPFLSDGTPIEIVLNPLGVPARMNIGQVLETHLGWAADRLGFRAITPVFDGAKEQQIAAELARSWLIDLAWEALGQVAIAAMRDAEFDTSELDDDLEVRTLYLRALMDEEGVDEGEAEERLRSVRAMRRYWLERWLMQQEVDPTSLLFWEDDERIEEESEVMDVEVIRFTLLHWLRYHGQEAVLEGVERSDLAAVEEVARAVSHKIGWPLPISGKMRLYNGKTGEPFDKPVTVGVINMLKLAHLVEDKVHARSTGPYSLVTQQPLGGKAQFGGQRFGEMEVWALEAYGAAHTLQEMLTIKSDDTNGRTKTYEAIVKGEKITEAGVPESFRVLVKELQSLGLSVEVINEENERMSFGKEEEKDPLPELGFGLGVLPTAGD